MYTLNIVNNYMYDCFFQNREKRKDYIVNHHHKSKIENLGNGYLEVPGMGVVNFIDLGAKKIDGYNYPEEHWGVLIRTHTVEGYYRYEGGGELTLEIDELGGDTLSTSNGTMIMISLPELTIN